MNKRLLVQNESNLTLQEIDENKEKEIEFKLFIVKVLYLFGGLSNSSWGRFGQIYYKEHNYNDQQIGILAGIGPLVTLFSIPIWGFIADKLRQRKKIFLMNQIISTVIISCLMFNFIIDNFYCIFWILVSNSLFAGSGSLLDAYVLDLLGEKRKQEYGKYRLYLALSWGLGCLTMGTVAEYFGFIYNFMVLIIMRTVYLSIYAYYIPNQTKNEQKIENKDVQFYKLSKEIFKFQSLFFLFHVFLIGIGTSLIEILLFVYVKQDLNGSTFLCGMCVFVTILPEIVVFQFSKQILQKLSYDTLIQISMFFKMIRFYGYSKLTEQTINYIFCFEILHGFTFAIFWIAVIDIVKNMSGEQWSNTFQSLLAAFYNSAGFFVGSVFGGWIAQIYGFKSLYFYASMLSFALMFIHFFFSLIFLKKNKKFGVYVFEEQQEKLIQNEEQEIVKIN